MPPSPPNKLTRYYTVIAVVIVLTLAAFLKWKTIPRLDDNQALCKNCNVILISIDTLRQDHLGIYGYDKNTTPNIDEFAKKAIVFENAYTTAPWTLPAHASLFTSEYPEKLKVQNHTDYLSDNEVTIAEIFRKNGYATYGISPGGMFLDTSYGLTRGFDEFVKIGSGKPFWSDAKATFDLGSDYIKENTGKKFFLFLHTFQVHGPFGDSNPANGIIDTDKKGEFAKTQKSKQDSNLFNSQAIEKYDEDIKFTDEKIKKVFSQIDESKINKNTIVIVMSDHGEEFGEHGLVGFHSHSLFEELARIPLIIYIPNTTGRKIPESVSLLDIAPTLLGLTGIKSEKNFQGLNLSDLILNNQNQGNRAIFVQASLTPEELLDNLEDADQALSHVSGSQREVFLKLASKKGDNVKPPRGSAVILNQIKLIENPGQSYQLYDLNSDKLEQKNLIDDAKYQELTKSLENQLKEFHENNK